MKNIVWWRSVVYKGGGRKEDGTGVKENRERRTSAHAKNRIESAGTHECDVVLVPCEVELCEEAFEFRIVCVWGRVGW